MPVPVRPLPVVIGPLAATPDEVEALVRAVIEDTYPAEVAPLAAEATCRGGRLARILAERTWFEARVAGVLVGVAAVHLLGPGRAALSSCFVICRGVGVGRRLLDARLLWARQHDAEVVVATTHPWNAASLANLTGRGFTVARTLPDGWVGHGSLVELTAALA